MPAIDDRSIINAIDELKVLLEDVRDTLDQILLETKEKKSVTL